MAKQRQTKQFRKPKNPASRANQRSEGKGSPRAQRNDADSAIASEKDNDVRWYGHNPELIKAAASLPFSQSLGSSVTIPDVGPFTGWHDKSFPGLYVLRYVPTMSQSSLEDSTDVRDSAMNIAANGIYTTIRSHNSGGKNYDAPNLMLYLLAMDNIYAFWSWMTRVYGCMRVYSQRNRYLPEMLVRGCGVDYDDLVGRMAEFRYYINLFAAKASSLCVPACMDYFQRHFWLCQNVFADDQTLKAQMYMFVPACFLRYHPKSKTSATSAETPALIAQFPIDENTAYTLDEIKSFGDTLLRAIITDEDMNVMSGDILKAFGEGALFKLSPIPEEHIVIPVYSEEVLTQIHNASIIGVRSPKFGYGTDMDAPNNVLPSNRIYEKIDTGAAVGYLVSTLYAYCAWPYSASGIIAPKTNCNATDILPFLPHISLQLFNLHKDDVSPEDVMVASRLRTTVVFREAKSASEDNILTTGVTGSEWIANATIYRFQWQNGDRTISKTPVTSGMRSGNSTIPVISMFQQHPIIGLYTMTATQAGTTGASLQEFLGDLDNYTLVDNETLRRIHETALLSEFNVPLLGAF